MKKVLAVLCAALLLGVAACSEEEEQKSEQEQAPTTQSEPAKTESQEAAPTTQAPAQSDTSTSEVTDAATDACLAAVKEQTGESDVAVLSTEFSEANSLVMVSVGAQRAPWKCLVSNDGQVAEVSFQGDDSAGVADQSAAENAASVPNYERPVGGVMPDGSSFSATGQIKCVRDKDASDAMCDFGVVREGNGNGWVMVFWPDEGSRVIDFENGTPSGFDRAEADGDAEMTVNKDGDTFFAFVGEARFEIPDAVINGG